MIVKFIFFTDPIIGKNILGYESICGEADTTSLANKKCQNLMTIYWLMVVGFGTFIISLITLYPFLKIKKNSSNHNNLNINFILLIVFTDLKLSVIYGKILHYDFKK